MSQYPATRPVQTQASASAGIDIKTLLITAVSSAAAAYTCSKLWAPGTLAAAAFTPVLVAIIREGLAKSTDVVVKVVPVRGLVRSAEPESPQPPGVAGASAGWSAADLDLAEAGQPPGFEPPLLAGDPAARVAQSGEIAYHGSGRRRRNWRVAIVTGLLGFVVAAVAVHGARARRGRVGVGRRARHDAVRRSAARARDARGDDDDRDDTRRGDRHDARRGVGGTVTVPPQTVTTPPPAVTTPEDPVVATTPDPTTTPVQPPPVAEPPPPEVP